MPQLNPNSTLNIEAVREIEATLPDIDLSSPMDIAGAEGPLGEYFDTYGFNRMQAEADYFIGYISAPQHRLVAHAWQIQNPRGTMFVAHGLFDHVGLFLDLIDVLLLDGFNVVAIDFPGHGLSEGVRGEIENFADYGEVIEVSLAYFEPLMPGPWYAIGQSTGCAAILNYVLVSGGRRFDRLVLLSPLIQPKSWRWVNFSYLILHRFITVFPRSFTENSHLPGFRDFLKDVDPLQPEYISVPWIGAMRQWIKRFDTYPAPDIPVLIIQGSEDGTVDWEKNVPRVRAKFPNNQLVMVDGGRHHLAKEDEHWQSQVFNAALEFLKD